MQVQTEEKFKECCNILKKGDILQADEMLREFLPNALDSEKVKFMLNCFSFWTNFIRQFDDIEESYERGEALLMEWKQFLTYSQKQKYKVDDFVMYCFKCGIFTLALANYSELINIQDFEQRAEITHKIGLCYKKLGEYETARNCLTESNHLRPGVPSVLAELADCFALCGEDRQAKVLFREAFFIDAQKIDLCFLESELINCLIQKVEEKGYSGQTLLYWIPVYGQIFGVFTVKRQLRSQEVSKLKQEIYAVENELKNPNANSKYLVPRLLNLYFWIIDHYAVSKTENDRISQILDRIKILDPVIYELYSK